MTIKWFARGGGVKRIGPFDDQVEAAAAMEMVGGGKPDNFATWPEEVPGGLFIVRLYDGFDNQWVDITEPVSKEEADRVWNEKTKDGTQQTKFADIDYYAIFPADTHMLYSDGYGERSDERE